VQCERQPGTFSILLKLVSRCLLSRLTTPMSNDLTPRAMPNETRPQGPRRRHSRGSGPSAAGAAAR
jgi:hypothetical protein